MIIIILYVFGYLPLLVLGSSWAYWKRKYNCKSISNGVTTIRVLSIIKLIFFWIVKGSNQNSISNDVLQFGVFRNKTQLLNFLNLVSGGVMCAHRVAADIGETSVIETC